MALPHSIADTQLGLSAAELHTFRQHQPLAMGAAPGSAGGHTGSAASSARGRSTTRGGNSSAATSRAASAASSAGGGPNRLLLDAGSLSVLGAYFERLLARIQQRVDALSAQAERATAAQARGGAATVAAADAEIARFRDILRQIDELEAEFDKVRHIRDIVKGFRARVDAVGKGLRR